MSKNILLILPSVLKERSGLHTNVDDKLIVPEIKAVQDMWVMPLLGSTLFNKIITLISDGTITSAGNADYKLLLDDYIIDVVCNYVLAELASALNAQYWNTGVQNKLPDNSSNVTGVELKMQVDKYRQRAEHHSQRCKRYLQQYALAKYPEYYKMIAGIDIVPPENTTYDCGMYLGSSRIYQKPQPSYNEPDRRFS